jgi:hypothetical protein
MMIHFFFLQVAMGSGLFKPCVHPDFRVVFSKMSFGDKIGFLVRFN